MARKLRKQVTVVGPLSFPGPSPVSVADIEAAAKAQAGAVTILIDDDEDLPNTDEKMQRFLDRTLPDAPKNSDLRARIGAIRASAKDADRSFVSRRIAP